MAKRVDSVYGEALFEAACENEVLSDILEEAETLVEVFKENEDFRSILRHPNIDTDEKEKIVRGAFQGKCHILLSETMAEAVKRGHGGDLEDILTFFIGKAREKEGIGSASVSSAFELSPAQKKKVEDKLLSTTKYKKINIEYKVDPGLIGGLVIKVGDKMVDSSVSTALKSLKGSLM